MWKNISLVAVALTALWVGGCGTVANLSYEEPVPYGGVMVDLAFAATESDRSFECPTGAAFLLGVWFADLCASAVGDTLTFPYVLWHRYRPASTTEVRSTHKQETPFAAPPAFVAGAVAESP